MKLGFFFFDIHLWFLGNCNKGQCIVRKCWWYMYIFPLSYIQMYDINDKLWNNNKVDYCFTIMSYNGLVYYRWLRPSTLFNKPNIIHMTAFVCIMFKIIAFFIIKLFARLYVIVNIFLTCRKKTWLYPFTKRVCLGLLYKLNPITFYWSTCTQKWVLICELSVSILPFATIFLLDLETILIVWYFYVHHINNDGLIWLGLMVLIATFNNILVISWR